MVRIIPEYRMSSQYLKRRQLSLDEDLKSSNEIDILLNLIRD